MTDERRMTVMMSSERLSSGMKAALDGSKMNLGRLAGKLEALDPLAVLSRGYGAVYSEDGKVIKGTAQLEVGMKIKLALSDGTASATVDGITEKGVGNE